MSNQWLRLWHDMPTDPKWRTIARLSGQGIALVQAVYLHMLVDASRNVTRGHVDVTPEDLASALDVTEDQIQAVLSAMEGRVINDGALSGWDKRQPKKEDSGLTSTEAKTPAQRKREQREREAASREVTTSHAKSREVTTDKDKEERKNLSSSEPSPFEQFYKAYPRKEARKDAEKAFASLSPDGELLAKILAALALQSRSKQWTKEGGKYVPLPATWLRAERWNDEVAANDGAGAPADLWAGAVN